MARLYSNNFSTTLNGAITAIATSMTLTSVTGFPAVGGGDTCQVTLDDGAGNVEIVTATAIAGSVITITRAQEGTTGFAFADLDPVEIRLTALSHTDVLAADTTPALSGHLELGANTMYGTGGSTTTYHFGTAGGVPYMRGAANYEITFTSSSVDFQAGTTFYAVQLHNSNGFSVTTNNVVRIQANNSGVQFGATGARITHTIDDDTMATASATTLATSESIKAYADSVGGGAPEGTAVLSTGETGGTKFLREDGDNSCSWQTLADSSDKSAFRAYLSSTQVLTTGTYTKLQCNTEDYDTNSDYDNATNYRYTPTVAGKYFIFATVAFLGMASGNNCIAAINLNGTRVFFNAQILSAAGSPYLQVGGFIEMNGSTDYVELQAYHDYGSDRNAAATNTDFAGVLV
jgi:hypothetical protein